MLLKKLIAVLELNPVWIYFLCFIFRKRINVYGNNGVQFGFSKEIETTDVGIVKTCSSTRWRKQRWKLANEWSVNTLRSFLRFDGFNLPVILALLARSARLRLVSEIGAFRFDVAVDIAVPEAVLQFAKRYCSFQGIAALGTIVLEAKLRFLFQKLSSLSIQNTLKYF